MSKDIPPVYLTAEQRYAIKLVDSGANVFITGPAGVGKSIVVSELKSHLAQKNRKFYVVAPTGIAALNVGGCTVHSWAGVGLAKGTPEQCYKDVMRRTKNAAWWRQCDVLIIDEISMMDPFLFLKLNYVGQKIRNTEAFFGGIQLVVVGDFFQLPPVMRDHLDNPDGLEFVFELQEWKDNFQKCVVLTKVHRQSDAQFAQLLSEIRQGRLSEAALKLLRSRINAKITSANGILPTRLFPTRAEADTTNRVELISLPGEEHTFKRKLSNVGIVSAAHREAVYKKLDDSIQADIELKLKKGAQVMLLVNLSVAEGLCNGSRGVVVNFDAETDWPLVRFAEDQLILVKPAVWTETSPDRKWSASSTQIPLKLGFGITIHKSQGLSIDLLEICLSKVFERGQGYVALSRAVKLSGLSLTGDFDPSIFQPHPKVTAFYENLNLPPEPKPLSLKPSVKTTSRKSTSSTSASFSSECVVCLDKKSTHLIVPCGHKCLCKTCAAKINNSCPMCRQKIQQTVAVFE